MDAASDVDAKPQQRQRPTEVVLKVVQPGEDEAEDARIARIGPFPCPRWLNPVFWFIVWFWMACVFKFIWVYRFVLSTDQRFASAVFWDGSFWTIPSFATLAAFLLAAIVCCYTKIVVEWSIERCKRGTYENLDLAWNGTKHAAGAGAKYAASGVKRAAKRSWHGVTTAATTYRTALANGAGAINSQPAHV